MKRPLLRTRTNRDVALRAHLLALLGEHFAVSPGYRRADDRLRARLRLAARVRSELSHGA